VERIFAGHYPCEERDGYVWVYMTSRDRKAVDNAPGPRLPENIAGCAFTSGVQQEIQDYASGVRAAFARGPGDYWVDGSGAWAVCASIVVLAEQAQHSREAETV